MLYSLLLLVEEVWSYLWKQNNLTCGSRLVLLVLGWKQNDRTCAQQMEAELKYDKSPSIQAKLRSISFHK